MPAPVGAVVHSAAGASLLLVIRWVAVPLRRGKVPKLVWRSRLLLVVAGEERRAWQRASAGAHHLRGRRGAQLSHIAATVAADVLTAARSWEAVAPRRPLFLGVELDFSGTALRASEGSLAPLAAAAGKAS